MKITPSNQTLILAGDRRNPAVAQGTPTAKTATSSGSVLQRVTIVAARPDTTVVYLRADYSPPADVDGDSAVTYSGSPSSSPSATPGTSLAVRQSPSTNRDAYGSGLPSHSPAIGLSSYLTPVEQYAQIQRILAVSARVPQIDVHA